MANEIALRVLGEPGDEVVAEQNSHIFISELGGPAVFAGLMTRQLPCVAGRFTPEQLRETMRPGDDTHTPATKIVSVENTHNASGGRVWPLDEVEAIVATARELELRLHLDGARVLNAATSRSASRRRRSGGSSTPSRSASRRGSAARSARSSPARRS